jgi:hypothetical protein
MFHVKHLLARALFLPPAMAPFSGKCSKDIP